VQQCLGDVIGICDAAFSQNWDTPEERRPCRKFQPQVVEPAFEAAAIPSRRAGITLHRIGQFLLNDGKFKDSERLNERGFGIQFNLFGKEHPFTLATMNNLASTYLEQGNLHDAVDLQERNLEASKSTLGEVHPVTLANMVNLAHTYLELDRETEAVCLIQQSVDGSQKCLGEDHTDITGSTFLSRLACIFGSIK
jgi:hypothetical protein